MLEDFYIQVVHTVSARLRGQHQHYQFITTYPTYNNTFGEVYKNIATDEFNFQLCACQKASEEMNYTLHSTVDLLLFSMNEH